MERVHARNLSQGMAEQLKGKEVELTLFPGGGPITERAIQYFMGLSPEGQQAVVESLLERGEGAEAFNLRALSLVRLYGIQVTVVR